MTIKQIDQIIENDYSLKIVAQAYSDIASNKVKKIRVEAERNRVFLDEIGKAYALVRGLALKKGIGTVKTKTTVCILITSNNHFYGAIDYDLIKFFTAQTQNLKTDRIIVGKMGIEHFKTSEIFQNCRPVILNRDMPAMEELLSLVSLIKDYNQVLVFYSQLKSLLVQEPKILDLTQSESAYLSSAHESKFRFVFEPDLVKILTFFEQQIKNLLLEGTFLESEAARTASRFISMDQAQLQADKLIEEYQKIRAYTKRSLENNLILESYASIFAGKRKVL